VKATGKMTRAEFKAALDAGRKFCWATLYERQDFMVSLSPRDKRPIREITGEINHWHRAIALSRKANKEPTP
jgi:hypothetical protein